MFDWILANPDVFGTIVGAIVAILLVTIATIRTTGSLRQGLLSLMLAADRARRQGKLGPIDGPQVMDLVIQAAMTRLVPRLPALVRPLVTPDRLRTLAPIQFIAEALGHRVDWEPKPGPVKRVLIY